MHCEDLFIDNGRNWQAVEAVRECLPQFDVVPPLAFVVESVYAINRSAFVIATQDEEIFRIFYLVGKKETDSL